MIKRLTRRYDSRVLEQLVFQPELLPGRYQDEPWLATWVASLETGLAKSLKGESVSYRIEPFSHNDALAGLAIHRRRHGVEERAEILVRFFDSPSTARFTIWAPVCKA